MGIFIPSKTNLDHSFPQTKLLMEEYSTPIMPCEESKWYRSISVYMRRHTRQITDKLHTTRVHRKYFSWDKLTKEQMVALCKLSSRSKYGTLLFREWEKTGMHMPLNITDLFLQVILRVKTTKICFLTFFTSMNSIILLNKKSVLKAYPILPALTFF